MGGALPIKVLEHQSPPSDGYPRLLHKLSTAFVRSSCWKRTGWSDQPRWLGDDGLLTGGLSDTMVKQHPPFELL